MQEGLGGRPPHPAQLIDLEIGAALVVALVEIVDGGNIGLLRRLTEGVQYLPRQTLTLDPPLSRRAVELAVSRVVVFHFLEDGQDVFPAPARIALRCPAVVISGLASHVDHAIDGGTSAQDTASRIAQAAVVDAGI